MTHRRPGLLAAALAVAVVAACTGSASSAGPSRGRWTFSGLILERVEGARGPIACFGGIAASLPPAACGGWPIAGWDWATAPEAREQAGVRTSYAVLVGHVEADSFVLDEAPTPRPAGEHGTYGCVLLGDRDEPKVGPGTVNARFDTPAARAAGLYPTNPHSFDVSYGGDPAVSGWLGLSVLVDTPRVRKFLLDDLHHLRVQVCSVLRPST